MEESSSEKSGRGPESPRLDIGSPQLVGRDGAPYHASDGLVEAANVALALRMPLLLTGEAGCGKTDFAYALASALHSAGESSRPRPIEHFIRSDTQSTELLYQFDALRRFSDAQAGGAARDLAADPRNYVQIEGTLGDALCSSKRCVVLIDEIDKAQRDLPNDLLTELDKGEFTIREIPEAAARTQGPTFSCVDGSAVPIGRKMPPESRRGGELVPLIVITSNVERRLPDAFLRRCVFFTIPFPSREELRTIVVQHLKLREGPDAPVDLVDAALKVFFELRGRNLMKRPTTSEAISWLRALTSVLDVDSVSSVLSSAVAGKRRWSDIPALCCLVKHRQDLEELQRG